MKKILLLLLCYFSVNVSFSQSDKQLTHYMFDQVSFNPAAVGYKGYCGTLIYRNQWMQTEGAPNTYLLNAQANLRQIGAGIGLSLFSDQIGFQREIDVKLNFAKHLPIVGAGMLSAGIGLGIVNVSYTPDWVPPTPDPDNTLPTETGDSGLDINMGLFFRGNNDAYYVGLSTTHITAPTLKDVNFNKARHYYVNGGVNLNNSMIGLPSNLVLKPSFLMISDFVTTTIDLTLIGDYALNSASTVYAGLSYRRADAISVLLGLRQKLYTGKQVNTGLLEGSADVFNFGIAYDITTSKFNNTSKGTLEFVARYCIFQKDPGAVRHGNPFILQ